MNVLRRFNSSKIHRLLASENNKGFDQPPKNENRNSTRNNNEKSLQNDIKSFTQKISVQKREESFIKSWKQYNVRIVVRYDVICLQLYARRALDRLHSTFTKVILHPKKVIQYVSWLDWKRILYIYELPPFNKNSKKYCFQSKENIQEKRLEVESWEKSRVIFYYNNARPHVYLLLLLFLLLLPILLQWKVG